MITKFYASSGMETLAEKRQVRVICSTNSIDRDGEIIVQTGINTAPYMASGAGTVLWNHNLNSPIAKCIEIGLVNGKLTALVQFPDAGEDAEADRYYGKIKFGSVSGVSIGFLPRRAEPMEKGNQRGPQKYLAVDLMEFSFTPVPSNADAMVAAKSRRNMGAEAARQKRLRDVEVLRLGAEPIDKARQKRLRAVEVLRLATPDADPAKVKRMRAVELLRRGGAQ
jgi:HK97 family phage prohead protease